MPVPDHLKGRSRAFLDRYGQSATIRTYTHSSSGGYAADDETRSQTTDSPYSTVALVESASSSNARNEGQTRLDGTHAVLVPDDGAFTSDLAGVGEQAPPSEVEVGGRTYRVQAVFDTDSGLLTLDAEVVEP